MIRKKDAGSTTLFLSQVRILCLQVDVVSLTLAKSIEAVFQHLLLSAGASVHLRSSQRLSPCLEQCYYGSRTACSIPRPFVKGRGRSNPIPCPFVKG